MNCLSSLHSPESFTVTQTILDGSLPDENRSSKDVQIQVHCVLRDVTDFNRWLRIESQTDLGLAIREGQSRRLSSMKCLMVMRKLEKPQVGVPGVARHSAKRMIEVSKLSME